MCGDKMKNRIIGFFLVTILCGSLFSNPVFAKEIPDELKNLYARSAVLMDADSGRILFGKNDSDIMDRNLSETGKYLEKKLDVLKLQTVDGLSVAASSILSMMAILMVSAIVLVAFAFGTVMLLGELIGDWAVAAFIIGGVFLILLIILIIFRKKLFVDMFVQLFIGMFYENE